MILDIEQYGSPILKQKAHPVLDVTDEIRSLASDMLETMHDVRGIGLAAPQVGHSIQLVVIEFEPDEEYTMTVKVNGIDADLRDIMPLVFINPQVEPYGELEGMSEGCLSIYKINATVQRPSSLRGKLTLLDGSVLEIDCDGWLARCLQHEIDHLNGTLFVDRASSAQKLTLRPKLKRLLEWE